MITSTSVQKMHNATAPLYPKADLVLRFYTMQSPSSFYECEFHCNRAAIQPLLRLKWIIMSEREAGK